MDIYYRMQGKGISLEDMQSYRSLDGASENEHHEGLCACEDYEDMLTYAGMWAGEEHEIVVFLGYKVGDLYDGVQVHPIRILDRMSYDEFVEREEEFLDLDALDELELLERFGRE